MDLLSIFISLLVFFVILSILILVHEFGHFIVAKKNRVLVEEFGLGLPPRIFGVKVGETLYSINWLPFGGFVKVFGEEQQELKDKKIPASLFKRSFVAKTNKQKFSIVIAGVIANFILGWIIITYLLTKGLAVPSKYVVIQAVSAGSPAGKAGIKEGDSIESIKTQEKIYKPIQIEDIIKVSKKYSGKKFVLVVLRESSKINIEVIPRLKPPKGEGSLGIALGNYSKRKYPFYQAPYFALIESANISYDSIKGFLSVLFKFLTFQKTNADVAGPIGIAVVVYKSGIVKSGIDSVLELLGLISLNLAVINILPFPALDGGKLAFILYEGISGKKVNSEIERRLNIAGFSILISLILLITIYEIRRYKIIEFLIKIFMIFISFLSTKINLLLNSR